jgi:hypothetical protein
MSGLTALMGSYKNIFFPQAKRSSSEAILKRSALKACGLFDKGLNPKG